MISDSATLVSTNTEYVEYILVLRWCQNEITSQIKTYKNARTISKKKSAKILMGSLQYLSSKKSASPTKTNQ